MNHSTRCPPDILFSPKYLLEVSDNGETIRLVEGSSVPAGEYCALSYVWGQSSTTTAPKQHQLTSSTYDRFITGFPVNELPAVLQDATRVVRLLGQRYLWIDALCIMFDDGEDKFSQIREMGKIYSGASLTIVAASSNSYNESFLHREHGEPLILRRPSELTSRTRSITNTIPLSNLMHGNHQSGIQGHGQSQKRRSVIQGHGNRQKHRVGIQEDGRSKKESSPSGASSLVTRN